MISRGLSIFRSFCKLLRNVVTKTFAEPAANCQVSSNRILIGTISRPSCPFICVKLVIHDVTCGFRLVSFYCSKSGITRPSNFRKFLQTAEECCNRNICRTFCKLGSLIKSNFDRLTIGFLYKCQISDSLFDVGFFTVFFYLLTYEVTRAPNFQTVLQTSEEFCNKNIPVVFTTSTNNRGGLQGDFDFFDLWLCYLQD